jgi:phosphatidylserine/phosphatidylglycerophosphate/cardiolipin synthase-like enzyme
MVRCLILSSPCVRGNLLASVHAAEGSRHIYHNTSLGGSLSEIEHMGFHRSVAVFVMSIQRSRSALCISVALALICPYSYALDLVLNNTPVQVLFNPGGRCADAIIEEIHNAKAEILVQAYDFTSVPIAEALVEAHKRGVGVQVIIDERKSKNRGSQSMFLANQKVPTYIDSEHQYAHNKVMLLDGTIVITGSFNFTKAAEGKNAENLLIIKSGELARLYINNWNDHRQHSEVLAPQY